MDQEIFKAGVRPGSPNSQVEIKMLLCFILSKIKDVMSFAQLYEALSQDALVNYFELVEALDQLAIQGHLQCGNPAGGESLYSITPLGEQAAEEFTPILPLSVRDRALQATERLLERQKRLSELKVDVSDAPGGGFIMELSIPAEESELVKFSLFVPTKEQCDVIRRRFLNAPSFIYKGVLALLTGDRQVLDELFPPPDEQLF